MARILYVSQGYSTHDRRFLARLADSGHEIWFLPSDASACALQDGPLPDRVHQLPALSTTGDLFTSGNWLTSREGFQKVLDDVRPDLVHAGPVQVGGFLAALSGFHPLLVMSWGSDVLAVPQSSRWMRWVTQFTLARADAILVDCLAVRNEASKLANISFDRFICFPWGIDLERFQPRISALGLRARLGWRECRVVINARSFEPIHGTMIFLRAMKNFLTTNPSTRILLLGNGTLRPQVEAFLREHKLEDKCHLAGHVTEDMLSEYFAEADLYISAGLCDGSSISLLEAMGCGLPVIVPDVGGNCEWVTHGRNGWLYPVGNASALADATKAAIENVALRKIFGKTNVEIVQSRADWSHNFNRLMNLYGALLTKTPERHHEADVQFQDR